MDDIGFDLKVWGSGGEAEALQGEFELPQGDGALFENFLHAGSVQPDGAGTSLMASEGGLLQFLAHQSQERKAQFDKVLARSGRTADPVIGLEVSKQMSELFLNHGLAVKVIGKTTQAVDTMMKMT